MVFVSLALQELLLMDHNALQRRPIIVDQIKYQSMDNVYVQTDSTWSIINVFLVQPILPGTEATVSAIQVILLNGASGNPTPKLTVMDLAAVKVGIF